MNKIMTGNICKASMICISLCSLFSCKNNENKNDHIMAEQLFLKSTRLIEVYIDSIRNAQDSMSFHRMRNDFDEKLAKINFQFPPDTDLKLTQEENDSLIRMLQKLVKVTREKEHILQYGDSVVTPLPEQQPNVTDSKAASEKKSVIQSSKPVDTHVNEASDAETKVETSGEEALTSGNPDLQ